MSTSVTRDMFGTYAALRLHGPPRRTLSGQALKGLLLVSLAPLIVAAVAIEWAIREVIRQRSHVRTKQVPSSR